MGGELVRLPVAAASWCGLDVGLVVEGARGCSPVRRDEVMGVSAQRPVVTGAACGVAPVCVVTGSSSSQRGSGAVSAFVVTGASSSLESTRGGKKITSCVPACMQ